jgi:G3E family GTPase
LRLAWQPVFKGEKRVAQTPVILITGFLGSGKTTLLNHLLRQPGMADTAVVINEFGEIAIDHLLVESSIENTLVLQSGCICCTVRGDLVDTLVDLDAKRKRGDIPSFSRVMIETTGLADPAPILHTLANEPLLTPLFSLQGVVTTIDAVNGASELETYSESVKQAALADVLLLTKCDLAEPTQVTSLIASLRAYNPAAALREVADGEIAADALFALVPADPRANPQELRRWLDVEAFEIETAHAHHHDLNRHSEDIRAFCLTFDEPIEWEALKSWLASITSLRGRDLLRLKGVVSIVGQPGPTVVQGVQHILHPPLRLPAWPDADHRTRLVFITRGISRAALEKSLAVLTGIAAATA